MTSQSTEESSNLRGSLEKSLPEDGSPSGILASFRSKLEYIWSDAPTSSPSVTQPSIPVSKYPGRMEAIYVSHVGDTAWTTVSLGANYNSAIPVCTVQYPWEEGRKAFPAIARVQNIRATSFEVRLQSPGGDDLPERPVHCIVVEQGSWIMPDGRTIEANQYVSTKTDHSESFEGEMQLLKNTFRKPIVIGQVLSYNDPGWSVFWSHGNDVTSGVTADAIYTGKHVGSDDKKSRINESIGYIVFESGHDAFGGIEIEAARGDAVKSYIDGSHPYIFETKFITAPMVAVLSGAGMEGIDGCWAVLCANPTNSLMFVATDDDRNGYKSSIHPSKGRIDYVAFSITGTVSLQSTRSMLKHQWYLPNIFSQKTGNGHRDLNDKNPLEKFGMDASERPNSHVRRSSTDAHMEDAFGTYYYTLVCIVLAIVTLSVVWITIKYESTAPLPHYKPLK